MIFPVSTLRAAMKGVQDVLAAVQQTGTVEPALDRMYTRKELYRTLQCARGALVQDALV